jgi:ABC-type nitrate/sulfonate/bicarbonate transport system substrate-binding protein
MMGTRRQAIASTALLLLSGRTVLAQAPSALTTIRFGATPLVDCVPIFQRSTRVAST